MSKLTKRIWTLPDQLFVATVYIFIEVVKILVPIIIFLLVLVGVVGNGMVLFVIGRHRDMKTITNYFIA